MKKIASKFKSWIFVILFFIFGIILIIAANSVENNEVLYFIMIGDFILLAMFLQNAIFKTFRYKIKAKKYKTNHYYLNNFDNLEEKLKANKFICKQKDFGFIYSKAIDKVLYKVVLILDSYIYFNQEEEKEDNKTPGIDKCTKFIGFEIFNDNYEDTTMKVVDFSIQNERFFYEGFYFDVENKELIEANFIEPNENFEIIYKNLMDILCLEIIRDNEVL